MYIVKGKVLTLLGEVPIEKLKLGDLIIDRAGSARKVLEISKGEVDEILHFGNNSAEVSADSLIYTDKGATSVGDEVMLNIRKENNSTAVDTISVARVNTYGYALKLEQGTDLFVNGYNFQLEGSIK